MLWGRSIYVEKKCENEIKDERSNSNKKKVRILVKALNTASLRQSAVRLQISCNLDLCLFSLSNLCV